MPDYFSNILDIVFKTLAAIAAIMAIFQLKEVRKKRLIDMYWKIAEIYFSEEQRAARQSIWLLETTFLKGKTNSAVATEEIIDAYNKDYHDSIIEENKKTDTSIINRIRFLNQTGVLLKRRLIDKDMLFGLIGVGLEIDYPTITIVLQAHRKAHGVPYMYLYLENTWAEYNKWKNTLY